MGLKLLCEKLAATLPKRFASPTEVFAEFARAYYSGNLLTIGKLIDGVFGDGAFRRIGEAHLGKERNGEELLRVVRSFEVKK